jgi:hypothetical protein
MRLLIAGASGFLVLPSQQESGRRSSGTAQLKALHLYGIATAWNELLGEGPRRPMQPEACLDRLNRIPLTPGEAGAGYAKPQLHLQQTGFSASWKNGEQLSPARKIILSVHRPGRTLSGLRPWHGS